MECITKLLSGSELIHHKLNGPKELPTSGWKEYCPNNSWLEQKQIQASLEDKYVTIGSERIEKQSNLAQAEWNIDRKKAKVLKTVGKHWEVVGHHENNEHWLLPEETLYLIEINVLELFHDGVPVSVEHAYALLLNDSNNLTLPEYRVYSYLSRRGYKLIRHAEDITVTRYEKQVHLDQLLETHKRNIPTVINELSAKVVPKNSACTNIPETLPGNVSAETTEKINQGSSMKENLLITPCRSKRRISDSEDVCIIEDNIEIIEIEDIVHKKLDEKCSPRKQIKTHGKMWKNKIPECLIIIDEELEDENDQVEIKNEYSNSSDNESDDEVVLVKSVRLESQQWYKPLRKCLLPAEPVFVDLSDDTVEIKLEKDNKRNESLQIISNKSRKAILDEMINAKSGVSFIKSPNACVLPKEIVPRHSQYKVNLNMRQEQTFQHSEYFCAPNRRPQQFYNPNFLLSPTNNNTFFGDNVLTQASEMRAMVLSMIQAASSLMSVINGAQPQPNPPLMSDTQIPQFNSAQFSNSSYQPRLFNNNMFNNNSYNNNFYNQPRNQFASRNYYGRRNFRYRGPRNHNRSYSSHQKQLPRYGNKVRNLSNAHQVVLIDSEDDSANEQREKRVIKYSDTPRKKGKYCKSIELIDLCEEKVIKNENTNESEKQTTSIIIEHDFGSDQNEIDQKPDLIECKQESARLNEIEEPDRNFSTSEEPERGQSDFQNVEEAEIKSEKFVGSNDLLCSTEKRNECSSKFEFLTKNNELLDNQICETSLQSSMDIATSESPGTIEESNDSEAVDIMEESNVAEFEASVPDKISVEENPTSWQQYKEQSDQEVRLVDVSSGEEVVALTQPNYTQDIATLLKNLQIFESIEIEEHDRKKQKLKISFDAYLPTDHFKKSVKMLPKFRIIVVSSTDSLPSNLEIDMLKSSYQDEIPFLYAIVYDDAIAFYYYDLISLPQYYN